MIMERKLNKMKKILSKHLCKECNKDCVYQETLKNKYNVESVLYS